MKRDKGSVFIMALVFVVVLTLMLTTAATRVRIETLATRNAIEAGGAERMAESALARALASLSTLNPNQTSTGDDWANLGSEGGEVFVVDRGRFQVQVVDAGGFVNINTAGETQLQRLPIQQEQVDSILDWRSGGQNARTEGGKDQFYNDLANPYNAKLRRFDRVTELLLVRGFTPALLYDVPDSTTSSSLAGSGNQSELPLASLITVDSSAPNVGPDSQQRLNVNTATAQQLAQRGVAVPLATAIIARRNTQGTFTTLDSLLQTPGVTLGNAAALLDNLSVNAGATDTGKLNLNAASDEVLRTIPNMTEDLIQAIATRRGSFASLGELAGLSGVTLQTLRQIADFFTVGANVFLVRAMGEQGGRRAYVEAVVTVTSGVARVTRRETPPFSNMPTRWAWPEETSQETVLVEAAN